MIRPCQLGDLLLVQRLGGQATTLNAIQALLQPRAASITSLGAIVPFSAIIPWFGARANTYVLRQNRNSLAQSGFIQTQERFGRPEADITLLAPALDTSRGHPAIWEKLLAHYIQEAATRQIMRVYADVPDQPLPVKTFTQTGFRTYTSQTIWRLNPNEAPPIARLPDNGTIRIRPQTEVDIWALQRLYAKITPKSVQRAEGFGQGNVRNGLTHSVGQNSVGQKNDGQKKAESDKTPKSPLFNSPLRNSPLGNGRSIGSRINGTNSVKLSMLDWWHAGCHSTYVLTDKDDVHGCILIGQGQRGSWLRLLVDTLNPNPEYIHALIVHGLTVAKSATPHFPIYIGVRDYHGGLASILSEYEFVPFTDRARMVRQVPVWARTAAPIHERMLDAVGEAIPTTFTLPQHEIAKRQVKASRVKFEQNP